MVAEVIAEQKTITVKHKPRPISWETFKKVYLEREDGFKYEWVDGYVEKTQRTMAKKHFFIQWNLLEFLTSLKVGGLLIPEGDIFFSGKHRRPDIAY